MREDRLYHISGSTTIITVSMVAACLLSLVASLYYEPQISETNSLLPVFKGIFPQHIRIIINLGAILVGALLLLWINNIYTIVRAHTSLPLLFFLLLECSNPELTTELRIGNILVPVILLSVALLYSTYQNPYPQNRSFTFALLISIGSLFWLPFIFFLPLFWIGLYLTRALNWKSFFASLIGVVTIFWLFYGGHFIWDYPLSFNSAYKTFASIHPAHKEGELFQLLYFLPTIILGFVSGLSSLYRHYSDKISTRVYNEFINVLSVCTAFFIGLNILEIQNALPLLNACVAIQAAHLFNNITSKAMAYLFYAILIIYLLFYLWILLQDLVSGVI
ncbi:hypothetical protein [Coprobacter sp.]